MLNLCQVDGFGINSLAQVFCDLGYSQRDELTFPAKKLKAYWYAPPAEDADASSGDGVDGPLPRVFISELLVGQLSNEAQVRGGQTRRQTLITINVPILHLLAG